MNNVKVFAPSSTRPPAEECVARLQALGARAP